MLNNNLKTHINQVDTSLKSTFDTVEFDHKDMYHSIVMVSDNRVNEDLSPIKVLLRIDHEKLNRDTSHVDWSYSINPDKDDSRIIKRTSLIENIGNDVLDIVLNKRMDKKYIEDCLISLIQENDHDDDIDLDESDLDESEGDIDNDDDDTDIDDEFKIGESILFTDYEYNEKKGIIQKKISLSIMDKEYKGWIVKTENGDERKVMDYDIQRNSRLPKWWNN